jgi:hypothetical protein
MLPTPLAGNPRLRFMKAKVPFMKVKSFLMKAKVPFMKAKPSFMKAKVPFMKAKSFPHEEKKFLYKNRKKGYH